MSLFEVAVYCQSNETAFHYLQEKGIISQQIPSCTQCGRNMMLIKHSHKKLEGLLWRCPSHKGVKQSIRGYMTANLLCSSSFI